MKATVMYGAHDVRVEDVPDARIVEPSGTQRSLPQMQARITLTSPVHKGTAR